MTHALFSLSPLEIVVGGGGGIVFKHKEWVIQKGVVESEKTEKNKKGY